MMVSDMKATSRGSRTLLRFLRRTRRRATGGRISPAAVLGEIADELVHRVEIRGVDDFAAAPLLRHEPRAMQALQVKGHRRRRHLETSRDRAGIEPIGPALHQEP